MVEIIDLLFRSLRYGSFIALAALGIVLIFRTSRTTNFAQGTIGTFGVYVAAWALSSRGFIENIWIASLLSLIVAFFVGILIDVLVVRKAGKISPLSKQIITLGLILFIIGIMPLDFLFGPQSYSITTSYFTGKLDILGASIDYQVIFFVLISLVLMGIIFWFIQKTKWGLATRVTASSAQTSKLMGVPTERITMLSWAIAAILGTMAGLMVAQNGVRLDMLVVIQVSAFFAGVFGGFSTFHGPVIAAYLIALFREITYTYISDVWSDTIVWVIILVVLFFLPYGLFGKAPAKKV